mgnify:CR=1 FL=1
MLTYYQAIFGIRYADQTLAIREASTIDCEYIPLDLSIDEHRR